MVVQEEDDTPVEAPLSNETKKYLVVKNHVRELLLPEKEDLVSDSSDNKLTAKSKEVTKKNIKRKKMLPSVSEPTNISESDLEELKTVYTKCKLVLQKIESKYGHLLDLDDNKSNASDNNTASEELSCDYCSCSQKKKIIFDENGQQIQKDCQLENHICVKRMKRRHSDTQVLQPPKQSIQIEYDPMNINLPDNLQELEGILKDNTIDHSYRRMVIDKAFCLRQEYLSEIRFEKQDIISKLKENSDNVLDFKGTNLSTLQGYCSEPENKTINHLL